MPNLNHRFSSGRMNKDLDERLVPNGEYRDALNIEVATSDTSDMGTVQTVMGNLNMSLITIDPNNTGEFYCVGSVVNEQHDKIYWMLAGRTSDIIAEYDYKTQTTTPVVVDLFPAGTIPGNESGRVLNFDKAFIITGINIIENMLFWTDNHSEPKRIHIDRCKLGTPDFTSQTQLYVRDISTNNASIDYYPKGDLKHEHITVIKKRPHAPPVLEMRNTTREDQNPLPSSYGSSYTLEIKGNFTTGPGNPFYDNDNEPIQNFQIQFNLGVFGGTIASFGYPDFVVGDIINIYIGVDSILQQEKYVRAEIINYDISTGLATINVLSGTKNINSTTGDWYVELEQAEPLFQFKFPRFGLRYKYEDGEYSTFSPFSQVAFLPQEFDYLPKEGYNLGMVNNLRFLAIKDFVHGQSIPDDVISVDILYKESNSPNIYTVKTIKRLENDWVPGFEPWSSNVLSLDDVTANYSEWNAIGPKSTGSANGLVPGQFTRGWTRITSEMIHAILPSNQLLRPYDNVPRVALAQEVVGNRLVYGNYLQNYNMFNRFAITTKALEFYEDFNYGELDPNSQISVDIKTSVSSNDIKNELLPEQFDAQYNYNNAYGPAKSIKTLRTYQLGVSYIDEYGRETPVFSNSTMDKSSLYVEKVVANQKNKLQAQLFNTYPEWAKSYKFFVKETSSEYYNLAMDRWYDAEDGNIWISFPSSERNKIDEETFLILKKEHDNNNFVSSPARYKVIAIANEAPIFVKTSKIPQPTWLDSKSSSPFDLGGSGGAGFPAIDGTNFILDQAQVQSVGWEDVLNLQLTGPEPVIIRDFDVRFTGIGVGGDEFSSDWYRLKSFENLGGDYKFNIFKKFKADVNVLSTSGTFATYTGGAKIELRKRVVENKPEFDGRFFVKIRRDGELESTIIKPVASAINWQVTSSTYVQYINPYSTWSTGSAPLAAGDPFYGYYNNSSTSGPEEAISISEFNGDNTTDVNFDNGVGQSYWSMASHNLTGASESSGWFIDRVEGFRRFPLTKHYFGQTNTDKWNTINEASGFDASWAANNINPWLGGFAVFGSGTFSYYDAFPYYNWAASPGSYTNARNFYNMPIVVGTSTTPTARSRNYLGLTQTTILSEGAALADVIGPAYLGPTAPGSGYHWIDDVPLSHPNFNEFAAANNINGAADYINQTVLRTGLNGYFQEPNFDGDLRSNGGNILPSLGIDGHPNANDTSPHLGELLDVPGFYQGTNIITLSHSGVNQDHPDADDDGLDAPTQDIASIDQLMLHFDFIDAAGSTGVSITKHVDDTFFINKLLTPGTVWRWAEDPDQILYKTTIPDVSDLAAWGISNTEFNINFGANIDPLDAKGPGIGLYNYCRLGDWADYLMTKDETGLNVNIFGNIQSVGVDGYVERAFWVSGGAGTPSLASGAGTDPNTYYADGGPGTISPTGSGAHNHWKYSDSRTTSPTGSTEFFNVLAKNANTCGGWSYWEPVAVPSMTGAPIINVGHLPRGAGIAHGMWPMYVKDWWKAINRRRRYMFTAESYIGGLGLGEQGSKYLPTNEPTLEPHFDSNGALKTTIPRTPAPGIRSDGVYSGYNNVPFGPTNDANGYTSSSPNPPGSVTWQILEPYVNDDSEKYTSTNPAIWETEPKESVDLNVYYEVGQTYPIELNEKTGEQFVGPIHPSEQLAKYNSKVTCYDPNPNTNAPGGFRPITTNTTVSAGPDYDIRVKSLINNVLTLCNVDGSTLSLSANPNSSMPLQNDILVFTRPDGGKTETSILSINVSTGEIVLDTNLHNYKVTLPWHNCYSFGNGVESDRIRDDFNQVTIDNGPKASTTLEEPYEEERRGSGLIYSGIYNSMSGVNNLNQFIQAEKITKDLNPSYGTIQKLYARNTNLVTLCEDKVFKILANKDALFNADGNSNVTATDRVLGQTIPYAGDFGISKNPESFVNESFRSYFTDKVRGQVLRLSQDGITPISDFGMSDWFSDNLKLANRLIGSYDEKKDEYNLTLDHNDYPVAQPVHIIDNFIVEIESENCGCGGNYDVPTGRIITSSQQAITAGMVLNGPGLALNTVVTSVTVNFSQLILTVNPEPAFTDVVSLFGPNPSGWQTHVALGTQPEPFSTYTNTSGNYDLTVSFSERSKGWTSFKSWAQESGVSLNNTYYTFKGGHLHEHHVESQPRNNFYGDQYDSSIEVLFNEAPELVKSFNTLNYEGTQSRVTPDVENSGEYWDNYLHTGWYVSNMLTNLQEGSMQEFREKEGKWFSQIKGVTTEWLDDGKAGNIDTREFSYQGIDEADDITVTSGGYTSYDCLPINCPGWNGVYGILELQARDRILSNQTFGAPAGGVVNGSTWRQAETEMFEWFFDNPTFKFTDYYHLTYQYPPLMSGNEYYVNGVDTTGGLYMAASIFVHTAGYGGWAPGAGQYILPSTLNVGDRAELTTAEEAINYFATHYNTATYGNPNFRAGMSFVEFKTKAFSLQPVATYSSGNLTGHNYIQPLDATPNADLLSRVNCPSNGGYSCQERQDQDGEFPTLSACEAVCGVNVETYDCVNGQCVDPGDGSGEYSTYCECVNDSLCCDEGLAYAYICQNIAEPTPVIYGCMDDGITTDLYTTRFRPPNWVGAASNYYPAANTPDCSCEYNASPIPETYDCSGPNGAQIIAPNGSLANIPPYTCYDPNNGQGQYTNSSAISAGFSDALTHCQSDCTQIPCNPANLFSHNIVVTPATQPDCDDGLLQIFWTNITSDILISVKRLTPTPLIIQSGYTIPTSSHNGSTNWSTGSYLVAGDYEIEMTNPADGCGVTEIVSVPCTSGPPSGPCNTSNLVVDYQGTNANGVTTIPSQCNMTLGNNCCNGSVNFNIISSSVGATSFTAEIYQITPSFVSNGKLLLSTPNDGQTFSVPSSVNWNQQTLPGGVTAGLDGNYGNPVDGFGNGNPTHYEVKITTYPDECEYTYGPISVGCSHILA